MQDTLGNQNNEVSLSDNFTWQETYLLPTCQLDALVFLRVIKLSRGTSIYSYAKAWHLSGLRENLPGAHFPDPGKVLLT